MRPAGPATPNPRPLVSSLSGAQFVAMMCSGVKSNGVAFPGSMPWQIAAQMTDGDLVKFQDRRTVSPPKD